LRPWVLSLVILALGAGGVFGQATLLGAAGRLGGPGAVAAPQSGAGAGTSAGASTGAGGEVGIGTAPLPVPSQSSDQSAVPVVPALAHPLTAAGVGWPLARSCRVPLARHGGDPVLSSLPQMKRASVKGTVVTANRVDAGELGGNNEPGTAPTVARRSACVEQLWTVVRRVFPQYAIDEVDEFVVFVPTVERAARGEVVGFVVPSPAVGTWTLALAPHQLSNDELAHTMIHELGHLLTLNESQWDANATDATCDWLPPPDGCLSSTAILSDYVAKAWNATTYRSFRDLWGGTKAPSTSAQDAWYRSHRGEFYNDYAATSLAEDFAESFAAWCLREPVASTLKPKISFFDGRADLKHMDERCAALR